MNDLELAIKNALDSSGANAEANKAYLEFIKANFIIPVKKNSASEEPEVLYLEHNEQFFLPVFTSMHYLDLWAEEIRDNIQILKLSGVDLLKGIGEEVTVCLNIGSTIYKEFNPAELARMRSMVLKLFSK
ncbi:MULTISPECIES: SseB family protein [unclassified Legionella]|uniref:SseB family protein n=1 Tax=unclassified Legionella TaxID=2622702 RepID=UPI0010546EFD|nr:MULTISPECIES: SseB family protein [unclassified Legionella]MDI9819189.1 SseB family protein [Legionella sp. PL877]